MHRLWAEAREVYDVSGAGDTVVAALGAAVAAGRIAGLDAARAWPTPPPASSSARSAPRWSTAKELSPRSSTATPSKAARCCRCRLALDHVARWRRNGLKLGFTNGCFDLIHPGHVALLEQARKACDRLVVGINSDASVQRLKGPGRPVQNEAARAAVLASLADGRSGRGVRRGHARSN